MAGAQTLHREEVKAKAELQISCPGIEAMPQHTHKSPTAKARRLTDSSHLRESLSSH